MVLAYLSFRTFHNSYCAIKKHFACRELTYNPETVKELLEVKIEEKAFFRMITGGAELFTTISLLFLAITNFTS